MKQSLKRLLSLILALFMIVAAFIVFFQFTQPEYRGIQIVLGEQSGRLAFIEKQESAISQVKKLIDAYKGDLDFQVLVSNSFPQDPETSGAISQLSGLIELNNLSLKSFSVQKTKAQQANIAAQAATGGSGNLVKPISTLTFKLELLGTYEDMKRLIDNIETNIRIFDVKNFSLTPAAKSNQNLYNYSLEVATYYQN